MTSPPAFTKPAAGALNSRAKASHSLVGVFTVTVSAAPVVSVQTHISLSAMSLYELIAGRCPSLRRRWSQYPSPRPGRSRSGL